MTNIKEYDSITIACQYKDDDGLPLSLAGVEIKSEMRTQNSALIDELEVTVSDVDQGLFHLRPTKTRLPTGYHNIDILFTKNGNRISSDTFHITVSRAVTQGPTNA